MGWTTIDDGAFTTDSDSPLSSAHCVKLRDNAAYVSAARPPQTGIAFPKDEPVRLCTFVPMCLGPFWIYLPPGESYTAINVRIRIEGCDYDGESAGVDAAYLHVTTGRRGDAFIERPPGIKDDWEHTIQKGDSGILTFANVEIYSDDDQYGWKPVFLWIWSNYRDTAESTGEVESFLAQTNALGVEVLAPVPSNQPPERVIAVAPVGIPTQGFMLPEDVYQIAFYSVEEIVASDDRGWAELFPIAGPESYVAAINDNLVVSVSEYGVYTCGVVLLQSISIEAVAPAFEPRAAAYHSDVPAAEQWLTLSQTTNVLVNFRTPQWLCHPGPDSVEVGEHSRIWPIRASSEPTEYNGAPELDSSSWLALAAALVLEEPVNDNGYFAIISLVLPRFERLATEADVKLRLSAYTAGTTTLQASSEEVTLTAEDIGRMVRSVAYAPRNLESYSPMFHAIAGSTWHGGTGSSWQQRGLLGFKDPLNRATAHDWENVMNVMLQRLPQDSISYTDGIRLVIEGQLSDDDANQICVVIGAGIRSGV
jgi:hypothetical protein